MLHAVLCPEHERVLAYIPVGDHVLPARLECHLAKVVRLGVKEAECVVSLVANYISKVKTALQYPNIF